MLSWIDIVHSFHVIKHMGDPKLIVEYVNQLEEELENAKKEISSLQSRINEKSAEIQYLQSVARNGGY